MPPEPGPPPATDPVGPRRGRSSVSRVLQDAQWWLIGVAAVVAFVLGWFGFRDYQRATGAEATGFWDHAYRSLQLFTLESGSLTDGEAIPGTLQVARFLAPLVTAGAVVRAVLGLFREQAQLLRLRLARDHVLVCGAGRKGLALCRSLHERGQSVVAIDPDAESDTVVAARAFGIPVLVGDATDPAVLRRAGVERASHVVALCGQSATNAQIATVTHQLSVRRRRPLTCLAHLTDPDLSSLLRARFPMSGSGGLFRLEFFDTYDRAARVLLQRHPAFGDGTGPPDSTRPPHLLVIGFGRLGHRLVVQAARAWRTSPRPGDRPLRLTVVDPGGETKVARLLERHPELRTACDIRTLAEYDADAVRDATIAYVCIGDEVQALLTGMTVHASLRERGVPVVVRATTADGLPTLLRTAEGGFHGLSGFAMLDESCDADLLFGGFTESLAQMLHARYLATREAQGWTYGAHRDSARRTHPALAPWTELAETFKDANRDQAAHTWAKLAAVDCQLDELTDWDAPAFRFTDDEIGRLAELEHERWMDRTRRVAGRHGHEDLVPWEALPEAEREVDREFVRVLPQLLAQLGFQITRNRSADRPQGA